MADRTTLSQDSVAELLEMCLRSTYFSYGGNFNEQKELRCSNGLPGFCQDGLPYMEFFKDVVLGTVPSRPRLWTRYVDDIFCTHRKVTVEELFNDLNRIRPTIKLWSWKKTESFSFSTLWPEGGRMEI